MNERVFRQSFMDNEGKVSYGPEEVIDAGPFPTPGIGSFVELEDGWYRLRRKDSVVVEGEGWPEPAPLPEDYWESAQ